MNKVLDLISKIACFVLCIILFFVLCGYLTLNAFNKAVNKRNITDVVSNLDMEVILDEGTINSLYEDADKNNIDRSVVDELIESKEFKELTGKIFGNALDYVLYGNEIEKFTVDEVVDIMEKQLDIIVSEKGINLSNDERNNILKEFEEAANEIVNTLSFEEDLNQALSNEEINTIRFVFGKQLQMILLVVIFIIVGIIALFRWSIYRFAIWTGVVTVINGIIFAALGAILRFPLTTHLSDNILKILDKNVFNTIKDIGLIVLGIGVVQIIYYIIMKKSSENVRV